MRFSDIQQFTRSGSYQVRVPWSHLLEQIKTFQKEYALDLCPDFQRGHVWIEAQRSSYVEFILQGGQSARTLYFNHPEWMTSFEGEFVLVDGLQRLTSVMMFLQNQLSIFSQFYFADFTDRLSSIHHYFDFNVNNLKTKKEVLQWYLDYNSGGTVHTETELQKVRALLQQYS